MEAILNHTEFKIDKSDWVLKKFGDLVEEPKETCKNISAEGIEHVVGLEHIDSGNIRLRKSATIEESTTFSKKFRRGDVLFGRRRAYLKKAAQAEFDGICSGDITVFRAKAELSSALLPFIVYNDKFFDYAVKHSAGGLSPRVKFKDLANYEFLLPPKEEQARLAELLWAMDEVIQKEKGVLEGVKKFRFSYLKDLFLGKIRYENRLSEFKVTSLGSIPSDWRIGKVGKIAKVIRGSSPRPQGDPRYYGGPVPRLMGEDVTRDGKFVTPKVDSLTLEGAKLSRPMPKGSLVMICSGNVGLSSFLAVDCCIHDGFIAFPEISDECDPNFLYYTFNSQLHRLFQNATHGGVFTNLTTDIIKNFEIVVPSKEEQAFIGSEVSNLDLKVNQVISKVLASQSLQKSLINQIF